jgi:hypothetical protein
MSSSCDKRVWWKNEGGAGERRSTYSGPVCRRARSETNGGDWQEHLESGDMFESTVGRMGSVVCKRV